MKRLLKIGLVVALVVAVLMPALPISADPDWLGVWGYQYVLPSGNIVEVGNKDTVGFKPHLRLNRWDGECFIALWPAGLVEEEVEVEVEGNKVKCKYKVKQDGLEFEWESVFYPLEPDNQYELGGFEFEIILNEKPVSNQVIFNIETQGLKFYYQPALTSEEIAEGAIRPDNVVGSYAVYHDTRTNMHTSKADAGKYRCGKAFHWYRPLIWDSSNPRKEVWGELMVDAKGGIRTVTIPQDFLDSAVYPVTIDDTFGYTSAPSSQVYCLDDNIYTFYNTTYSPASDGVGVSMSLHTEDSGEHVKCALYNSADESLEGQTLEGTLPGITPDWVTSDFDGSVSVYSSMAYRLAFNGDGSTYQVSYDDGAVTYWFKRESNNYAPTPFTNPANWTDNGEGYAEKIWGIYCTYTPSGGTPPTVTTQAATNIEATTATGNGNITAVNNESCDIRGFVWDLDTHSDPGNISPAVSNYANDVPESNGFGTSSFTGSLSGLPTGDTIYVRAYAHNVNGYGYGDEINFLTKPAAPTNVSATDGTYTDKAVITWTKSDGATKYQVYRNNVPIGSELGDVDTLDDLTADAPTITPGSSIASNGTFTYKVTLSLSGTSANKGTTHTYKVEASNVAGWSGYSISDTGYRDVGGLTYQWQRSLGDADTDYSNIDGATAYIYEDVTAPAPTIIPGDAIATDGTYVDRVALCLAGIGCNDGAGRWYQCLLTATGATGLTSASDRGYRGSSVISYQWQRSSVDTDEDYSNIVDGTTDPYNDTDAPADGAGRYYRCLVDATDATQQTSSVDRGYREVLPTVTVQEGPLSDIMVKILPVSILAIILAGLLIIGIRGRSISITLLLLGFIVLGIIIFIVIGEILNAAH